MKRLPFALLLSVLFVGACGQSPSGETERDGGDAATEAVKETHPSVEVNAAEAAAMLKENPDLVILDIRTPGEFNAGHIKGAVNIDFNAPDYKDRIAGLEREKSYLMHCASGGRSGMSMELFEELQFENIIHFKTGFRDWADSGLPVEK